MRVPEIKNVHAFGSLVISLSGLWANRIATKRDLVSLNHLALAEEFEGSLFLGYNNMIGT